MPRLSARTKTILISIFAFVLLAVAGKVIISHLYPTDLKTQLAHMLGVQPQVLWINLPPAKNRAPGAVFIYQTTLLALESVQLDQDDLSLGTEFDLGWVSSTGSRLNGNAGAGFLGLIYDETGHVKVDLNASKCRSIEMPLNKLKQRLLKSEEVKAQAALGREPLIVVRAYEAILTLRVSKTSATSAEAWAKIKASAKSAASLPDSKVAVQGEGDDLLEVKLKEPVIFAYEMVSARLISTHLGAEPNDIQFTAVKEPATSAPAPSGAAQPLSTDPRRWTLATVAVSHFPKTAWLQQEWNAHSADTVKSDLSQFLPTDSVHFRTAPARLASADEILRFAESIGQKARASDAKMLLFYYIGHAVTTSDGQVYLLQSEITPQALKSLANGGGTPGEGSSGRGSPRNKLTVDIPPNHALNLADLHAALSKSQIPFAILLDGCMQSDTVKQAIEAAGFQYDPQHPTLYYVGAEPLTQRFISVIGTSLQKFGKQSAYLGTTNPVVFAAKPGTLAMIGESPDWEFGPPMAPLAQKVRRLLGSWTSGKPQSLADLLTRIVDFRQGIGELELTGSISWSNFSVIEQLARGFTISGRRLPFSSVSGALVANYQPHIGKIESFYYSERQQRFYIVSTGNDWHIWSWQYTGKKRLISSDRLFPVLSGTYSGHVYLHYDQDKTLAEIRADGKIRSVRTAIYVEQMAPSFEKDELLVIGEASTIEEAVPVWTVRGDNFVQIDEFKSSGILSAVVDASKRIIYVRERRNAIYVRDQGRDDVLVIDIEGPEALARSATQLFCISDGRTRLHKITRDGRQQADLLLDDGAPLIQASNQSYKFQATSKETLLMITGDTIVELDPKKLQWSSAP